MPRSRSRSRDRRRSSRSRSRSRDRARERDRREGGSRHDRRSPSPRRRSPDRDTRRGEDKPEPPRRRIQPNHGILGSLLRQHARNNDRMDKEEVDKATKLLKHLDPGTHRTARLLSGHLSAAPNDDFASASVTATELAVARLRAAAVGGEALDHIPVLPLGGKPSSYAPRAAAPAPSRPARSISPDRMVECPHNPSHTMPHQSLKHHLTKCPDRPDKS